MEKISIKEENRRICILDLCISASVVVAYLVIVAVKNSSEESLFGMGFYAFFFLFQFILYTILVQALKIEEGNYIDSLLQVGVFTLGILPLLMVVAYGNQIGRLQPLLPLSIQYLWGIILVNIKQRLAAIDKKKVCYVNLFNFVVMVGGMMLFYLFYQYKSLVLVSVFDKRIPKGFFINPLLTIIGILRTQMGEVNHIGYVPVMLFLLFWIFFEILLFCISKYRMMRRSQDG